MRHTIGRPRGMQSFAGKYHEATASDVLIARMDPAPSGARATIIASLVNDLIDAGVWDKITFMFVLAAHSQQAALLNWKGDVFNGQIQGSPAFEADRGFTSHLNVDYVYTAASPVDCGTTNDAHFAAWTLTSDQSSAAVPVAGSVGTGGDTWIDPWSFFGSFAGALNAVAAQASVILTSGAGMRCVFRQDSVTTKLGYNSSIDSFTAATDSAGIEPFRIGGASFATMDRQWAFGSAGFGFSNAEYFAFQTAVYQYLSDIDAFAV